MPKIDCLHLTKERQIHGNYLSNFIDKYTLIFSFLITPMGASSSPGRHGTLVYYTCLAYRFGCLSCFSYCCWPNLPGTDRNGCYTSASLAAASTASVARCSSSRCPSSNSVASMHLLTGVSLRFARLAFEFTSNGWPFVASGYVTFSWAAGHQGTTWACSEAWARVLSRYCHSYSSLGSTRPSTVLHLASFTALDL